MTFLGLQPVDRPNDSPPVAVAEAWAKPSRAELVEMAQTERLLSAAACPRPLSSRMGAELVDRCITDPSGRGNRCNTPWTVSPASARAPGVCEGSTGFPSVVSSFTCRTLSPMSSPCQFSGAPIMRRNAGLTLTRFPARLLTTSGSVSESSMASSSAARCSASCRCSRSVASALRRSVMSRTTLTRVRAPPTSVPRELTSTGKTDPSFRR